MKQWILFFVFIFVGIFLYGQEIEGKKPKISVENREIKGREIQGEESHFLDHISLLTRSPQMGPLQMDRYKIEINLLSIGFPSDQEEAPLDMLAVAKAEALQKSANSTNSSLLRQLNQIRSQVQVFNYRGSDYDRANNDLHFDSKLTPDGGIRNQAWQDIRQPFVNPYYGIYGRPYLSDYNRSGGLHFYRR